MVVSLVKALPLLALGWFAYPYLPSWEGWTWGDRIPGGKVGFATIIMVACGVIGGGGNLCVAVINTLRAVVR